MSEKYKIRDSNGIYFVTCTIVHWIDLFTRKEFKHIIIDSLKFCQANKGLLIHAWVLMPSHLHMIISTKEVQLENILRDFKKHTSRSFIKELNEINEKSERVTNQSICKFSRKAKEN